MLPSMSAVSNTLAAVSSSGASKMHTWSYSPSVQYICLIVTPIDCTLAAHWATRWVVCLAPRMPWSVNFTKLMYVGMIFAVPGVRFDLDSFSFEVPTCGFSAKHSAAPKKPSATINPVVFVFMKLIELEFHFPFNISFPERPIWVADAHLSQGKPFSVRADESAFPEVESAIPSFSFHFRARTEVSQSPSIR